MEDLFVVIAVIVIGIIRFVIAVSKTKTTQKSSPKKISSLDAFLQALNEPQKTKVAAWPKNRERPDYIHETKTFNGNLQKNKKRTIHKSKRKPQTQTTPAPPPPPPKPKTTVPSPFAPPKEIEDAIASSESLTRFTPRKHQIKNKTQLRQAIIGHIIFSPPKAFHSEQQLEKI